MQILTDPISIQIIEYIILLSAFIILVVFIVQKLYNHMTSPIQKNKIHYNKNLLNQEVFTITLTTLNTIIEDRINLVILSNIQQLKHKYTIDKNTKDKHKVELYEQELLKYLSTETSTIYNMLSPIAKESLQQLFTEEAIAQYILSKITTFLNQI